MPLAVHHNAQLEREPGLPALAFFIEFGIPVIDLGQIVAIILIDLDLPAGRLQARQRIAYEADPGRLVGKLQGAGEFKQWRVGWRFGKPEPGQQRPRCRLERGIAHDELDPGVLDAAQHRPVVGLRDPAVVVEHQGGMVVPAVVAALPGQHAVEHEQGHRRHVAALIGFQHLGQREHAIQAKLGHARRHAGAVLGPQQRRLLYRAKQHLQRQGRQ